MAKKKSSKPKVVYTQFEEENYSYADGGRIKEIETEIAEYEVLIADKSVPQDEKDFAKGEIADLKSELEKLKEKPAEKKAPAKAKAEPKPKAPVKPAPTPKAKAKAPAKKKPDTEHPTCEELEKKWNERREKAKKAAKKHKTVSVSEQIGNNIASAVGKVIDDIAAKDIEKNPTKYINAFEEVEDSFKTAMGKLKPLLGDDFDAKELIQPFEEILGKFITEIKAKYVK
jgi:hypothetical protein